MKPYKIIPVVASFSESSVDETVCLASHHDVRLHGRHAAHRRDESVARCALGWVQRVHLQGRQRLDRQRCRGAVVVSDEPVDDGDLLVGDAQRAPVAGLVEAMQRDVRSPRVVRVARRHLLAPQLHRAVVHVDSVRHVCAVRGAEAVLVDSVGVAAGLHQVLPNERARLLLDILRNVVALEPLPLHYGVEHGVHDHSPLDLDGAAGAAAGAATDKQFLAGSITEHVNYVAMRRAKQDQRHIIDVIARCVAHVLAPPAPAAPQPEVKSEKA
mmetsp:Transcript_16956/g.60123  ORF Transcript_16956/g.60123 Transcript_16956/m.60123 type:complete len:270 (+) Transcript_16956:23-832(+)